MRCESPNLGMPGLSDPDRDRRSPHASAPEQIASSSPDLKHGIFSYYLMKGMEGEADQNKDGAITVQEMQSYLSDSVGRKAMSLSRTQQPQVVGDQSKVLVGR